MTGFDCTIGNRKLKAVWSMEAQQDLRSLHNLDAKKALTEALTLEINAEIDAEILRDLQNVGQGGWSMSTAPYTPPIPTPEPVKNSKYRSIDDEWE